MGREVNNWCERLPEPVLFNKPTKCCKLPNIASFMFSIFQWQCEIYFLFLSLQERQGCTIVSWGEGHQDDQGSGTHDIWEEVDNCIRSALAGKGWLNILLRSSTMKWEDTDKVEVSSSQRSTATAWESMVTSCKKGSSDQLAVVVIDSYNNPRCNSWINRYD